LEKYETVHFRDLSDVCAAERLRETLESPQTALRDIHQHVTASIQRLYRQRNLVLHWGKTDAVALKAGLRTAAPLVGAGVDRIAHAWFVNHIAPLELAVRADIQLRLVGTESGRSVWELLE